MYSADVEMKLLRAKVTQLETCLEQLTTKQQRDVKALMGLDDILDKHRKAMKSELNDALERVAHIELTLFPHLPKDLSHLNGLIGDHETKAYNPLDFRDRSKKSS